VIETHAQRIEAINMHIFNDPDSHPEILEMLSSLNLMGFNSTYYHLLTSLHDFDAQLKVKLHLQCHLDRRPCQRIQIVPVAQHHQVPPPNRNQNHMLKMLRQTSSRPHTLGTLIHAYARNYTILLGDWRLRTTMSTIWYYHG
jgi:hypothetical protein